MREDTPAGSTVYRASAALRVVGTVWCGGFGAFFLVIAALNLHSPDIPRNDKVVIVAIFVPLGLVFVWLAWLVVRMRTVVTPDRVIAVDGIGRRRSIPRSEITEVVVEEGPRLSLLSTWYVRLRRSGGRDVRVYGLALRDRSSADRAAADLRRAFGVTPGADGEVRAPSAVAPSGTTRPATGERVVVVLTCACTALLAPVIFAVVAFGTHPHRYLAAALLTTGFVLVAGVSDLRLVRRTRPARKRPAG